MLEKYRNDTRISIISGTSQQLGNKRGDADYFFTRYSQMWGWATWRRVWDLYDIKMVDFPAPFFAMSPMRCPLLSPKLILLNRTFVPYAFEMFSIER